MNCAVIYCSGKCCNSTKCVVVVIVKCKNYKNKDVLSDE